MDKIEELIKKLEEVKEELNKNMNCAPGAAPNMVKADKPKKPEPASPDVVVPDNGHGKITIKDTETKPADASAPYGKIIRKGDEELMCSENGQWSIKKSAFKELEHKLEDEGKSEESAGAIAYSIGKKKYGKAGMEHKAEAAKKSEDDKE